MACPSKHSAVGNSRGCDSWPSIPQTSSHCLYTLLVPQALPAQPSPPEACPHPSLAFPMAFAASCARALSRAIPCHLLLPALRRWPLALTAVPNLAKVLAATSLQGWCCACFCVLTAHFSNYWRAAASVDLCTGKDTAWHHYSQLQTHPTQYRGLR